MTIGIAGISPPESRSASAFIGAVRRKGRKRSTREEERESERGERVG